MNHDLTIGTLAKLSSVNVETIRYYQRRNLLHEPPKPLAGYRQYSSETIRRVRFIKRAQALGFTLDEISGLLSLDERTACLETREVAQQKLTLIEAKISDLSKMKKALSRLVRDCNASTAGEPCPIIHLLLQD
jgi:MerR family mercuric resistance operon transcriptional regulator